MTINAVQGAPKYHCLVLYNKALRYTVSTLLISVFDVLFNSGDIETQLLRVIEVKGIKH